MKKYILIIPILLSILLVGCGKMVNPIFESKIVETLNKHIKAQKWTCKMTGDPNYQKASIPELTLIGDKIEYNKVIIEKLELNFKNVAINLSDKSIKSCDEAYGDITISDDALTELIKGYITQIHNPIIEVVNDKISIKGQIEILNKILDLEVKGNMRFENGINIIVEPEYVKVMKFGVSIPNIAKNLIYKKINPIYKIDNNPYGIYIDQFYYNDGYIHAKGKFDSIKIMELLTNK